MHEAKICRWNVRTAESFLAIVKMTNLEARVHMFNLLYFKLQVLSGDENTAALYLVSFGKKKDFIYPFYFKYSLRFR